MDISYILREAGRDIEADESITLFTARGRVSNLFVPRVGDTISYLCDVIPQEAIGKYTEDQLSGLYRVDEVRLQYLGSPSGVYGNRGRDQGMALFEIGDSGGPRTQFEDLGKNEQFVICGIGKIRDLGIDK